MNALEQIAHTSEDHAMKRVGVERWMQLSKHSPMTQDNRNKVRRALLRGLPTVYLNLTVNEVEWLDEMGYDQYLGQVIL
jgi:hypothetical protein